MSTGNVVQFTPKPKPEPVEGEGRPLIVWTCPCGNQLFYITPTGYLCSSCEAETEGPQ